ncbi:MAG: AraC family transcriptional regulator [Lachnospiraceae bacterium]|jgi:AraC-like DNA-binding protein|nr:AraC family transcriptional regulator [Lachnospiraceae bacterium]
MGRKKHASLELRYYDIPQNEPVLALLGEPWVRKYGYGIEYLHFHNLMEIGLCHEGYGILTLDTENRPYEPHMVSAIPRNYPHTTNSEDGKTSFWEYLFLDADELLTELYPDNEYYRSRLLRLINLQPVFGSFAQYPQMADIVSTIIETMRNKQDFYSETARGLTQALLFEIARVNKEQEGNATDAGEEFAVHRSSLASISRGLDYVSTHYREPIRVEDMAEQCNMSETHFRRLFSEYMNMNPVDYINVMRVQKACELMRRSNDSASDIAMKCGFPTPSTFHRNFKLFVGTTPYQWKKDPRNYESKLLQFHISAEKGW